MTTFPAPAGSRLTTALINHAYSISDANVTTVTATSATDLSSVYQIPASDAATDVMYELLAWGNGTWGSTAQNLFFFTALAGSALGQGSEIYSGLFNTSQVFRWRYTARLICVTTGSSATWQQQGDGVISRYNGTLAPGSATTNSMGFTDSNTTAVTQDSTVANDFSVQAYWASATGSPTLTCHGTRFSRCG